MPLPWPLAGALAGRALPACPRSSSLVLSWRQPLVRASRTQKPTLPAVSRTRNAENGRVRFETEILQQVGAPGFEQFRHLLTFDRLLQDDLAAPEVAGPLRADRFLADVGKAMLIKPCRRTSGMHRGIPARKIDGLGRPSSPFEPWPKSNSGACSALSDQCIEGPSHLVAETSQRADATLGEQRLDLFRLELATGDDLPSP